jgi:hypothetical protein
MRSTIAHEDDVLVTETDTHREPFSVGQGISVAVGVFFVVIGAVGLARTGLDELTTPTAEVAGLGMTPILALLHIAVGLIALLGGASRAAARGTMLFVGPILLAAGIIALMERVESLGWDQTNGVAYLLVGVVATAAAIATRAVVVSNTRSDVRSIHLP